MAQQACWFCSSAVKTGGFWEEKLRCCSWDGRGTGCEKVSCIRNRALSVGVGQDGRIRSHRPQQRWACEAVRMVEVPRTSFLGCFIVNSSVSTIGRDFVFSSWMGLKSYTYLSKRSKRRWLMKSRTKILALVPRAGKRKPQMIARDAVKVESGKYSYEVEDAINQLSALPPRSSIVRCMESCRNKLSMKDFALIFREFAQRGDWYRSLRLYKYMQRQQWCKPNEHIYTIIIGILGREGMLDKCTEIFQEMPSYGVEWNVYSFTALINAYGRNGQYEASLDLLARMKRERVIPNLITYNTVINACAKGGLDWEGLLGLFAQMRHEGVQPDIITYNTLLSACSNRGLVQEAKMVFRTMNEAGVVPDLTTYTSLVETYSGAGRLEAVRELLREMEVQGNLPDAIAYNVLIEDYAKKGDISEASGIFKQMLRAGCSPNVATYSTLLECYGKHEYFDDVRDLFSDMKASGTAPDVVTYSTLIQVFGKGGYFREAINFFWDMLDGNVEPNIEIYANLLDTCGIGGLYKDAEAIYQRLLQQGLTPGPEIFKGLIDAYGNAALYQEAAIAFNCIKELGSKPNKSTFNALIRSYARGGLHKEAGAVFMSMREAGFSANVHTFNALIEAYGKAGLFTDGKEVFFDMKKARCSQNLRTYEALLTVYCMAGLFDEAKAQFLEMKEEGMTVEVTSYCLMFSVCARWQRWDDAYKVLEEMQGPGASDLHAVIAGLIQGHFDEDSIWNQIVEPALENIKVNGTESNLLLYNALLEALWLSGQRLRAARVLREGRKRGVFPEAFRESKLMCSMDVHRMSVGAAMTTLIIWLDDLRLVNSADKSPKLFTIVTKWGDDDVFDEPDVPVAKAIYSALEAMGAPFKFAPWNRGRIISFRTLLMPWIQKSFVSETFLINIELPMSHSVVRVNELSFSFESKESLGKQLSTIQ